MEHEGLYREEHNLDKLRAEADTARRELSIVHRENELLRQTATKGAFTTFVEGVVSLMAIGAAVWGPTAWALVIPMMIYFRRPNTHWEINIEPSEEFKHLQTEQRQIRVELERLIEKGEHPQ